MNKKIRPVTEDIVKTHHSFLWRNLPAIKEMMDKVDSQYDLAETKQLYMKIMTNIQNHSTEEEQVLFPMFNQLDQEGSKCDVEQLRSKLEEMEQEHDNCSQALKKLRALNNDYSYTEQDNQTYIELMKLLDQLEKDLEIHIDKENNILHPLVKDKIAQCI